MTKKQKRPRTIHFEGERTQRRRIYGNLKRVYDPWKSPKKKGWGSKPHKLATKKEYRKNFPYRL